MISKGSGKYSYAQSDNSEIANVFTFVALNTDVEWSLEKFEDNTFALATSHQRSSVSAFSNSKKSSKHTEDNLKYIRIPEKTGQGEQVDTMMIQQNYMVICRTLVIWLIDSIRIINIPMKNFQNILFFILTHKVFTNILHIDTVNILIRLQLKKTFLV